MTNDRDDKAAEQAKGSLEEAIGKLTGNQAARDSGARSKGEGEAKPSQPLSQDTRGAAASKTGGNA